MAVEAGGDVETRQAGGLVDHRDDHGSAPRSRLVPWRVRGDCSRRPGSRRRRQCWVLCAHRFINRPSAGSSPACRLVSGSFTTIRLGARPLEMPVFKNSKTQNSSSPPTHRNHRISDRPRAPMPLRANKGPGCLSSDTRNTSRIAFRMRMNVPWQQVPIQIIPRNIFHPMTRRRHRPAANEFPVGTFGLRV